MASTGVDRVQGVDPSVAIKAPCDAATTSNITLSGAQTIDGVAVAETSSPTRVLVRAQTDSIENGVYDVKGSAWTRSEDFNGNRDVVEGTLVSIQNGTQYAGATFRVATDDPITIGTSSITFATANATDVITVVGTSGVDTYAKMRGLTSSFFSDGDIIKQTGDGLFGDFKIKTGTVTDDGGTLIVFTDDSDRYAERLYNGLYPEFFGAAGDGVTEDTTALQAWFDHADADKRLEAGAYLHDNLTIPNQSMFIRSPGHENTFFNLKSSPTNSTYGIASSAYVNNSTSGNSPIVIHGVRFNGGGNALYPVVLYGFWSTFYECRFMNASAGGYCLRMTSDGISGSACSTTLVENCVIKCRFSGGSGDAFITADTGARLTDGFYKDNLSMVGDSRFATLAGWIITGNHFYGGDVFYNKLSNGTTLGNNYYENEVTFDNYLDDNVSADNETFLNLVTCTFGANGETISFSDCKFQGISTILHNFFDPSKNIVINGGSFDIALNSFTTFNNASSTGWIRMNRVWSHDESKLVQGARQGSGQSINVELDRYVSASVSSDFGDASGTLTWGTSSTTNVWATTFTSNRTVTLSTTRAENGAKFKITRSGAGAFSLNIDTGGALGTLAADEWAEVEYDGSAWFVSSRGSI